MWYSLYSSRMISLARSSCRGLAKLHSSETTIDRAPRSISRRSLRRRSSSSSGRMTRPVESMRSLTPTIIVREISGSGLRCTARLRRSARRVPSVHWAPRPMRIASSWPSVVISPTRGPRRSIRRFMATVVEYRMTSRRGSSDSRSCPASSATSSIALTKQTDRSYGVVGALPIQRWPSRVSTASVKVPPTSMSAELSGASEATRSDVIAHPRRGRARPAARPAPRSRLPRAAASAGRCRWRCRG